MRDAAAEVSEAVRRGDAARDAEILLDAPLVEVAPPEKVYTPEEWATFNRRTRRALRKEAPEGPVQINRDERRFLDDTPPPAMPNAYFWWDRPFKVAAHLYTDCPRFSREWAGQDFKHERQGTARQAARHTAGMCPHCVVRFRFGRMM